MNWREKIRKRYDALSDEDQNKLYLLAVVKGYAEELPHKPPKKIRTFEWEIDITSVSIKGTKKEWEQLFLLTTQNYKHYSYADLYKFLKQHKISRNNSK